MTTECYLTSRADDKWHGTIRMLAYATDFKWSTSLCWYRIESSILEEYSNMPLFRQVVAISIGYFDLHILSSLHNRAKL